LRLRRQVVVVSHLSGHEHIRPRPPRVAQKFSPGPAHDGHPPNLSLHLPSIYIPRIMSSQIKLSSSQQAPVERKMSRVEPAPPVITLTDKVAIVTGASKGIGAAIATRLARDGAKVVVNFNSSPKEAHEVVEIIRSSGGVAEAVQANMGSVTGINHLYSETKRLFGRVDIVIVNAGVFLTGPFKDMNEKQYDELYAVNVKGVAFMLKNAAIAVEEGGRIVTIGSGVHRGYTNMGAYAGTKAATGALSTSLALELAPKKITVNTIHPGYVLTDMFAEAFPSTQHAELVKTVPMGRLGLPGDIADAVSLFVSEQARWITGQEVLVTGGMKD